MKTNETNEYYEYIKNYFEEAKKQHGPEDFAVSDEEIRSMIYFAATCHLITSDEMHELSSQLRQYYW